MSASDDTFYNIKRLHVVFALSAVALLAATVWMVAADHFREWKVYQRTYKDRIEPWLTEAQLRRRATDEHRAAEEALEKSLGEARAAVPEATAVESFCRLLHQHASELEIDAGAEVARIEAAYETLADRPGPETRNALVAQIDRVVSTAALAQEQADRSLRFARAELDEARTGYEAAVGEGLAEADLARLQQKVDAVYRPVDELAARAEEAAARHAALVETRRQVTRDEDLAQQALVEHREQRTRLGRALASQQPNLGKRLLRLPLIDALGRPLAVDQFWLPELRIDYNFRDVARFDRCRTCHQAIDKTAPGSADEPALRPDEILTVELATPPEPDKPGPATLEALYGLALAPEGMLDAEAATVGLVLPKTPAAFARLQVGDVIQKVGGRPIAGRADAVRFLTQQIEWGEPVALEIRRGLPHPYCSHPRLDLFVGSLSPHPVTAFGCTICHEGQGSATEFKFASHAPNDPNQRARWRDEHGWFLNEFWDFPMLPSRFAQSGCLKCHHEVTDLEPSDRFPDPPAEKLVAGYHLVRTNGCFGCHEIRGVNVSGERVGPDMRLEPNDAQAAALAPGTMRKVGPSLRHTAARLDAVFLDDWTADPTRFRPKTRMPRFFGMHEHLDGRGLKDARRFEAVEIRAITEHLLNASEPIAAPEPLPGVTEAPSAERGKNLFVTQGCLGCHTHGDFPEAQSTFAPDLSDLGAKLTTEPGHEWLVDWIRNPHRWSPRTVMPDPLLEPVPLAEAPDAAVDAGADAESKPPRLTDPAADIAAYLLRGLSQFSRRENGTVPLPNALVESDLDELVLMHLTTSFSRQEAQRYLAEGIPESLAAEVPADAAELLAPITVEKKLRYAGRRTIRKRGCFGCHDVPGFEDAMPIGPELSDFGRKEESLLAFEQVYRLLRAEADAGAGQGGAKERFGDCPDFLAGKMGLSPSQSRVFFEQAVREHRREGFVWQKLRAPRSFDYKKTENKGYNERLTMGRFSLTEDEREAIITFVLGLVADPPASQYVYHPDRRRRAIVEGRKVLDKYGCAECHTLKMERWQFEVDPDEFLPPPALADFDFLKPHFTPEQVARSMTTDNRGLGHAEVVGMPRVDASGELIEDVDDDDNPLFFFVLWEPAVIHGEICTVGGAEMMISQPQITAKRPPWGGAFARLLLPAVLEQARAAGSSAAEMEAFGWVPPPLTREGDKVQPQWLYEYLLDPFPVRPAVVLNMPKYNLSPLEATKLVDYFAATAGADFPYTSLAGSRPATAGDVEPERLDAAMRLVIDRVTFCAKCHLIGDYTPGDEVRTVLAPNLDQVSRRIRPEYLKRWLGNPKSALPYTGMPVNFPPEGPPLGQDLLPGPSLEQIDTVKDLLINYDQYIKSRTSIRSMIESAP